MKVSTIIDSKHLILMFYDFGITTVEELAAFPTIESLLFKKRTFKSPLGTRVLKDAWAKARRACPPKDGTVFALLADPRYKHSLKKISTVMDEYGAWLQMLKNRNALKGDQMETFVAKLDELWADWQQGEPTLAAFGVLIDEKFIETPLTDFFAELSKIDSIALVVGEVASYIDSRQVKDSFDDRSKMREWLNKNKICKKEDATKLINALSVNDINSVDDLDGYERDDLKEVGFKGAQVIKAFKALK